MTSSDAPAPDFELSDRELRATRSVKWMAAPEDVLPAWVAEMDVRPCPAVLEALRRAVADGVLGYPPPDQRTGLPEATAAFLADRFGWQIDPALVTLTGDVMAGVRLALDALCEPAPVVVPVPTYPPFLDVVPLTGRKLAPVPCIQDGAGRPALDIDGIERELRAGARTVLVAAPHNPLGRVFDAAELAALRDLVVRHRARVISDEIHAPLVLPGARHLPYAALPGAAEHTTTVLAATKAWNMPGLKCAQIIHGTADEARRLRAVPHVANHGTSPLGIVASVAAYRDGIGWLEQLIGVLAERREQFGRLLAERLADLARWHPMQATYLAWVDARGTGLPDPAATALQRGRVLVNAGSAFGPGYGGFVRVNLATSAERLTRVVDRLAAAWR